MHNTVLQIPIFPTCPTGLLPRLNNLNKLHPEPHPPTLQLLVQVHPVVVCHPTALVKVEAPIEIEVRCLHIYLHTCKVRVNTLTKNANNFILQEEVDHNKVEIHTQELTTKTHRDTSNIASDE